MTQLSRFVQPMIDAPAPKPTSLDPRELMGLARHAGRLRDLDATQRNALFELGTKSAADLLDEWFESDQLKAPMSVSGIIGTFLGVRSPGTAYVLLHHYMGEIDGAYRSWGFAKGGTGMVSISIARAAQEAGATIRTSAGRRAFFDERTERARGVVLENGEELQAKLVVSGLDPHLTFLKMLEEQELPTDFVAGIRRFKMRGSSGKVNLAVDRCPEFSSRPRGRPAPARGHRHLPQHRVPRARLRRREIRSLLEAPLPERRHPVPGRPEPGASGPARRLVLRAVRSLPPERGRRDLAAEARGLRRRGGRHLGGVLPGPEVLDPAPPGADALGSSSRSSD